MPTDQFGGVAVEEPQTDEFGGVALADPEPATRTLSGTDKPISRVPIGEQSTTYGGPRKPLASAAELEASLQDLPAEELATWNTPILHIPQPLTEQEEKLVAKEGTKGENAAIGAAKSLSGTAEWFTSPLGVATLGIGALPRAAQRIVAGAFAAKMASDTPEIANQLGEELGKSPADRNYQKIAELTTSGATAVGFTALAGAHALTPGPKGAPGRVKAEDRGQVIADMEKRFNDTQKQGAEPNAAVAEPPPAPPETQPQPVEPPPPSKPTTIAAPPVEDLTAAITKATAPEAEQPAPPSVVPEKQSQSVPEAGPVTTVPLNPDLVKAQRQLQEQVDAGNGQSDKAFQLRAKIAALQKPKKLARGITGSARFRAETEMNGPDILSWMHDTMKMMSKAQARATKGREWARANASLWDDSGPLEAPHHNVIYSEKGSRPDQVAQAAYDEGLIKSPDVPELWQAIKDASAKRKNAVKTAKKEAAYLAEEAKQHGDWFNATSKDKAKGNVELTTEDVAVGDILDVEGERVEVTHRDPETGDVTLKDGRKFGTQVLSEGKKIYVQKFEEAPSSEADFVPEQKAEAPKLRPGEKAGDLFQGEDQPFNLAGEKGTDAERIAAEKAKAAEVERLKAEAEKAHPQLPGTTEESGGVVGFGGVISGPKGGTPIITNPKAATVVNTTLTPGLNIIGSVKSGVQSLLLPSAKSPAHLTQAEILGSKLGSMHQRQEAAASHLKTSEKFFDKLGVNRGDLAPAANKGLKFMSDMSQGRPLSGKFKAAADTIDRLFGERIDALEKANAPLQTIRENYFPGMWTKESRLAFNAAMEQARQQGMFGPNFDVNNATPAQRATIKAVVDANIEKGVGSDKDGLAYLTRRPIKGRESFRKQKVFEDIMDAAEFGLRPVSYNPIDLVKLKLAEMDKSIMANQYFQELKSRGELKILNPYEEVPDGWVKVNDEYGTIYGKPTVTVAEHIDKAVYEGLLDAANKLGIRHERSMKFPPGQGQSALGLSYQGQNLVRTKFATETSVLAHEIGHQLDHKYGLWDLLTGGESGRERKSQTQKELRAIADLTGGRTGKTRTKLEKIAQLVEAYVHAPDRMMQEAPYLFNKFENFLKSKPELKGITEIRPGIELTSLTAEKYVGLPIMGYRIVPTEAGDIMNNYLSSSLYNNRYFGTVYKGWMGMANALNQSQLGLGSAFHAGFTTGEAQVSANANVIKDIYGVARGNRSVGDLGETIKKATVGSVNTAIVGDRVLNAWREKGGTIDPKIAQVVKAAELAGGGFKLETGLRTEQTAKAYKDWYAGNKLKAAARSPIALVEQMARPIMDYLVPRQKAGVFADLAWRIIEQNPGKELEELRPEFRQAWNRTDARLGQVRYDRLFANNTAKNVVQGVVRAPGWSGGTIAELGGAFPDAAKFLGEWIKTGKMPENIPDRTAYAISLLLTVGTANAVLTYAFTGQKPRGIDYLAFRTGKKDENGNDERFLLPTYMKDVLAYTKAPLGTLANKTHPFLSMLNEVLLKNQDYYGVEVRSPDSSIPAQAGQVGKYVIKSFEPFWTRGARKEISRDAGAVRTIAPFFGVMPAPPKINNTAAENLASEILRQQMPRGSRTQEQFDASQRKQEAVSKIKRGTITTSDAVRQGIVTTRQAATDLQKRATQPYLDYAVSKITDPRAAVRVYESANEIERRRLYNEVGRKIVTSRVLTPKEKIALKAQFDALSR